MTRSSAPRRRPTADRLRDRAGVHADELDPLLDTDAAARVIKASPDFVRMLARSRKVPHYQLQGETGATRPLTDSKRKRAYRQKKHIRYRLSDLKAYLRRCRVPALPPA